MNNDYQYLFNNRFIIFSVILSLLLSVITAATVFDIVHKHLTGGTATTKASIQNNCSLYKEKCA